MYDDVWCMMMYDVWCMMYERWCMIVKCGHILIKNLGFGMFWGIQVGWLFVYGIWRKCGQILIKNLGFGMFRGIQVGLLFVSVSEENIAIFWLNISVSGMFRGCLGDVVGMCLAYFSQCFLLDLCCTASHLYNNRLYYSILFLHFWAPLLVGTPFWGPLTNARGLMASLIPSKLMVIALGTIPVSRTDFDALLAESAWLHVLCD